MLCDIERHRSERRGDKPRGDPVVSLRLRSFGKDASLFKLELFIFKLDFLFQVSIIADNASELLDRRNVAALRLFEQSGIDCKHIVYFIFRQFIEFYSHI